MVNQLKKIDILYRESGGEKESGDYDCPETLPMDL
jgi:hypothetical protein